MKWLSIGDIKAQTRIDFDCEDALLELYGSAAEDTVLNYINRTYQEVMEDYGCIPTPVRQATLLLVAESYMQREPVSQFSLSAVPYSFDLLLKPYIRLTGSTGGSDIQQVTLGSDIKIAFSADLPDGMLMKDVGFTVTVYNADKKEREVVAGKDDCIIMTDNEYVVLVNTDDLGVGLYMMKALFTIPDTDYPSGFRKLAVRIDPKVKCNG